MKKTLLTLSLILPSLSAAASDRFSNDYFEIKKSSEDIMSVDKESYSLKGSLSLSQTSFIELHASESEIEKSDFKEKFYGAYVGMELPLSINQNAVVFGKLGAGKIKFESEEFEFKDDEELKDIQLGLRWDYGLPRLDLSLFVGREHFNKSDFNNTYYGIEANYFLTRNFSLGASLKKNEDLENELSSFNIRYHW